MMDEVITVPVDPETARFYRETSAEDQRKIQRLLRSRLRELVELPAASERQIAEMSADPEIQRELRNIEEEFGHVVADGLGKP